MTPKEITRAAYDMLLWMADFTEEEGRIPRMEDLDREFFHAYPEADYEDAQQVSTMMLAAYLASEKDGNSKRFN